jgi:hypothetical protein
MAGLTLGVLELHTYTIHDDDFTRKIHFSVASSSGSETVTPAILTVTIDAAQIDFVNPTTADYYISGGTATGGGVDYTLASGTVTIPANNQTATISIPIVDDALVEMSETIIVTLTNPTNCNLSPVNPIDYTYTILDNEVFGYTGPGGVGNSSNNKLWLKADANVYNDAGTTLASNGNTVWQWNDQSGNANNALQTLAGRRPTYIANAGNSKPALQFDGTRSIYPGALNIAAADGFTYFAVIAPTTLNYDGNITADLRDYIIDRPTGVNPVASLKFVDVSGIGPKIGFQKRSDAGGAKGGTTAPNTLTPSAVAPNVSFLMAQYYRTRGIGYYITTNGNAQSNIAPDYIADTDGDLTPPIPYIGGYQGGTTLGLIGYFAELAVYNGSLNSAQRLIIDNYLSVKYGIAMTDLSRKKYAYAASYSNELAGIGRMSSVSFHADARGSGIVRINNASALDDNDFMLWARDGGVTTMTAIGVDGFTISQRMTRKWQIDINGNADGVGTVTVSFDFTNIGGASPTTPYFLMIDRDNDGFTDNDVVPLLGTTAGNIVTFSNVTFQKGDIFTIGNGSYPNWTGNISKDWSFAGNWSPASVPTSTSTINIPSGRTNYPELISSSPAQCTNINIQSGAWVNVPAGTGLIVSNTLNIDGAFTIKSDATGTGSLIDNGIITGSGTIKVERYLGGNIFHYISSPISNAPNTLFTVAPWGAANPNFYLYNNALPVTSDWLEGWDNTTPKTGNLSVAKGYSYYIGSDQTVIFQGPLNTGTYNINVTNAGKTFPSDPWNLIGNPYPSGINANSFIAANSGKISGTLYFWDDDGTLGADYSSADYASWNGAGGIGGGLHTPNSIIGVGQAFFVSTSAGSTTVTFNNSMRAVDNSIFFKKKKSSNLLDSNYIQRLYLNVVSPQNINNETLIAFKEDATDGYDNLYDGLKLKGNKNLAFYSLLKRKPYAIQTFPLLKNQGSETKTVPLGIDAAFDGNYTINLKKIENIGDNIQVYLEDQKFNKLINLKETPSYQVFLNKGTEVNRFRILFSATSMTPTDLQKDNSVVIYSNTSKIYVQIKTNDEISGNVEVYNLIGMKILDCSFNNQYLITLPTDNNQGIFIVKVTYNGKVTTGKVFVR